ncbi:helix-turn-helix transcriptional regulator [Pseudobacillus sp. FSL P4-0506]|uniref:helix-turn-helix transcriptional regulator n=1 Tax=Pseudobacillus sp. FSL P4-0506 TaxID=2921576 RepID=UPI0030F84036
MNRQLVKAIRDVLGLNQHRFSKEVGVSRSTIAYIEAGYTSVSPETQRKITEAVGADFVKKVAALLPK